MAESNPPIEQAIWIEAPPEVVFDHFVDADLLLRWMGDRATLIPVTGGEYRVKFKEGWTSLGAFVTVERPHYLVYTIGWEGSEQFPPGSTRVEVRFVAERGGTTVHLRHFGPPSKGLESDGWALYLARLKAVAENRRADADPFDRLAGGSAWSSL